MDPETYAETVERLREVNAVIADLDEAIRADAFRILRPYIDGQAATPQSIVAADSAGTSTTTADTSASEEAGDAEAFIRSQDVSKPADAVKAIGAWWFSQYGSAAISRAEIEQIANEVGVTIPDRPDATVRGMKTEGKDVYRAAGRGKWTPTRPHGEKFFQTEYGVTKGRKEPPAES